MKKIFIVLLILSNHLLFSQNSSDSLPIKLPQPTLKGNMSVEEALLLRRSIRDYQDKPLTIAQISQVLWSAYGVSDSIRYKTKKLLTSPSAGATYPLEIYILVGKVEGLEAGIYKYNSDKHTIKLLIKGDFRRKLMKASYHQEMLAEAPATIFWSAVFERTTSKYGKRGQERYVCMDLGHSAQNVYLQCEALGLGTCAIGAMDDEETSELFMLPKNETPLYSMPIGYKK